VIPYFYEITFELYPNEQLVTEDFWTSKADLISVLNLGYLRCSAFENAQLNLENIRLNRRGNHWQPITPNNNDVSQTFTFAYQTINTVNMVVGHASEVMRKDASMTSGTLDSIVSQALAIRAFTYYNMAMLWGNVIILPKEYDDVDYIHDLSQSSQKEVLQFAYNDICNAVKDLPESYQTELENTARFTHKAGLMIKAEIELTLGKRSDAMATLNQIQGENDIFSFVDEIQNLFPIYTSTHQHLFMKEAEGETEGMETEWLSQPDNTYGCWAALKRLGKAQEVTGCETYELLMPIPSSELHLNPNLTQNPGY
jgi:hypothetical protein